MEALRDKKFNDVKEWVTQNLDSDPASIMRKTYDNLSSVMDGPSVAAAVLIIAEYQYKSAFAGRSRNQSTRLPDSTNAGV